MDVIQKTEFDSQHLHSIEIEVERIWRRNPGIGIKALMVELKNRVHGADNVGYDVTQITKQRVKAAKAVVPYVFDESDDNSKGFDKVEFVQHKVQERQNLRVIRRFKDADFIQRGLEGMGIILDDNLRTWKVREKSSARSKSKVEISAIKTNALESTGIPCSMCGRHFFSRNLLFKHLKDPSSSCGNSIFAAGKAMPHAPSEKNKKEKQERTREAMLMRRRNKTGNTTVHSDKASSLWIGDLPLLWTRFGGKHKRLRAILRECLPRDVPQPWLKTVVRKGYRSRHIAAEAIGNTPSTTKKGEYLGYAIVVFRDLEEAESVRQAIDGVEVRSEKVFCDSDDDDEKKLPSFHLKVRSVENSGNKMAEARAESNNKCNTKKSIGKGDPPLSEQLRPLSTDCLRKRVTRLKRLLAKDNPDMKNVFSTENGEKLHTNAIQEHENILNEAVTLYEAFGPRKENTYTGRPIPESILTPLLEILISLRWPARNQRQGLSSERYLVLQRNESNRFYNDLLESCIDLMEWADPNYYFSGIAVTKNFVASPHIDDRDQSYQYAVSLGSFEGGGELCVEGYQSDIQNNAVEVDYVNVIETKNCIARVDGRHVHWVRSWNDGERFSLIFYDTTDRFQTPIIRTGADLSFLDVGLT